MTRKGIAGGLLGLLMGVTLSLQAAEKVDINTADSVALAAALNGIGAVKAEKIVEYRKVNGPFRSIDDLASVKGIGEALVARNRDRIEPITETAAQ